MFNIAIDGPGGAGKSSVSRAVSKELGFIYVDTGALYRAVGLYALRNGVDTKNETAVGEYLPKIKVELVFENGEQKVLLNGEDVSADIRLPEASMAASDVSKIPSVRKFLFDLQREIAAENNCLMDGRDIGTVVLPKAELKIFLTASPEARARRRYDELVANGSEVSFEEILKDLNARDYQDSHREIAPLKPAEDSVILDTTDLTFEEVKNKIIELTRERQNHGKTNYHKQG